MFDAENIMDLFLDNIRRLLFPEEWIELDLKFSKFELFSLLYIGKRKEITMTELVEYINTPMSTATGIIDRLVRNGYVRRERSETDRRIVVLGLTEEGMQLINKLREMLYSYISLVVDELTEEEEQFLTRIILKIMGKLQKKWNGTMPDGQNKDSIKKIEIE